MISAWRTASFRTLPSKALDHKGGMRRCECLICATNPRKLYMGFFVTRSILPGAWLVAPNPTQAAAKARIVHAWLTIARAPGARFFFISLSLSASSRPVRSTYAVVASTRAVCVIIRLVELSLAVMMLSAVARGAKFDQISLFLRFTIVGDSPTYTDFSIVRSHSCTQEVPLN